MMLKKKIWTTALCLGLLASVGGTRLAAADPAQASSEQELRAKMAAQDWKEISLGVFERQRGENRVEHIGYGREGLVWTVGELTRQRNALLREYQSYPSEDLQKVIDHLSVKIAEGKRELRNTKDLSNVTDAVTGSGCSICYGATSDAYPLSGSSGQGVGAIADANFNSSCGYSGDTYAYAYGRATLNGTTTTHTVEDPHTGTSVTSHASAIVNGTSNCLSTANSYAQSTALGISYTTSDTNSSCPMPPPTITGPATATIAGSSCQTLTWSATTNGGASPFSYAWTIDGVAAGTSSSTSVSKSYCGNNTAHSQSVNVALTLTDSTSQTASSSFTTAITYTATPPPTVSISSTTPVYISGTTCSTVTWTAVVSGGTSPFSYAWTIDGVAAGTSTSTYVTKTYCGLNTTTTQTVNVGLSVTDATSQTGSASYTTTIYFSAIGGGGGGGGCLVSGNNACA